YDAVQANPEVKDKLMKWHNSQNPDDRVRQVMQEERQQSQLLSGSKKIESKYPDAKNQRAELNTRAEALMSAGVNPEQAYEEAYFGLNRSRVKLQDKDKAKKLFNRQSGGRSGSGGGKTAKSTRKELVITDEDRQRAARVNMTPEAYVRSKKRNADRVRVNIG